MGEMCLNSFLERLDILRRGVRDLVRERLGLRRRESDRDRERLLGDLERPLGDLDLPLGDLKSFSGMKFPNNVFQFIN